MGGLIPSLANGYRLSVAFAARSLGSGETMSEIKCPECDVIYEVIWSRNPVYDHPEFCPFCGDGFPGPEHVIKPGSNDDE